MTNPPKSHEVYPDPAPYYEPILYPVATRDGAPSCSRIGPRITQKLDSVIMVPGHDEKEGTKKMRWGDKSFSLGSNEYQINPNPPMEATPDQLTNMDEKLNAVESVATSYEIGEIMEIDNLDLNKLDDGDTNILLQEVYL